MFKIALRLIDRRGAAKAFKSLLFLYLDYHTYFSLFYMAVEEI